MEELLNDPAEIAKSSGLRYVNDEVPGIRRKGAGKGYSYYFEDTLEKVSDPEQLNRIKSLVLPPAWKNVWISKHANSHLQATGIDSKGRKQYRYHATWVSVRNETKYHRMIEFGNALPQIRQRLKEDLASKSFGQQKVLALVVSLMERTAIRVGNEIYKNENGSFGLTTLRDRHVKVEGSSINFVFIGKKGIKQNISLKSRKLARLVQRSKDIPGYELFQYYDENGEKHPIDSHKVNEYIKEISGSDFTAKDFRTWAGTVNALQAFRNIGTYTTQKEVKSNIVRAIDYVSEKLGNTRAICKKYYIHPAVIEAYEDGCIFNHFEELNLLEQDESRNSGLTCEEEIVLRVLQVIKKEELQLHENGK